MPGPRTRSQRAQGAAPHRQPPRRKGPAGLRARGGGNDGYTNTSHSFTPASLSGRSGGRRLGGCDHSAGRGTFVRPGVEGTSPFQATRALPARHGLHVRRVVAVQRIRLLRLDALDIPQPRRPAPSLVDGPVPSRRRERERPDTQPRTSQGRRPRLPQDDERARRSRGHLRRTGEVHLISFLGGSSPAVDLGSVLLGTSLGGSDPVARNALDVPVLEVAQLACLHDRGRASRGSVSTSPPRTETRTSCIGPTRLACCGADTRRRPLPAPRPPNPMTPSL
jgi:hypothetical protein